MQPGDPATQIGGRGAFPSTLWTMVLQAGDPDAPNARPHLERLCEMYWKPVYWLVRLRWNKSNELAKDLTQEFFARMVEKDVLQSVAPDRGRFRSFIRAALENFMRNYTRDQNRQKRGGKLVHISIDREDESIFELPSSAESIETTFNRLWAQSLMQDSLQTLRDQYVGVGKESLFKIFEEYSFVEENPPTYRDLAVKYSVTEDSVRGALRRIRSDLRNLLRDRVLQSLTDPDDLEGEMSFLFGKESA
ncbi:MAG: sigma-70 family RNA polymerase sigma factor [Planctomycetota bacterium]|nr:sigma-70 family RNA polymerase sigma factor [Planctomycetota bacterium]